MRDKIRTLLNSYGKKREPIFFMIDFDLENFQIYPLNKLPDDIFFEINGKKVKKSKKLSYSYENVEFITYKKAFDQVIEEIKRGNSYLLNLTFSSKLNINLSLEEIYQYSDAKFKLLYKDHFVCFSPERFVKIKNNQIFTYPMKGTIDAKIPDAASKILNNQKEMAEHVMVVDLLRNDLSQVASKVRVEKFRYIDSIKAGERELLQVSSKIKGDLKKDWQNELGNILTSLLPAGSITGAPKKSTVEIIKKVENYKRGYFTGIFGVFNGNSLDSGVMIRFIQKSKNGYLYKSGGGITIDSNDKSEYEEMKEKIYVPFF